MTITHEIPQHIRRWAADFWDAHLETDQVDMVALAFMEGQAAPKCSRPGLTTRQADALTFIERYQSEHDGVAPTFSEIGKALGLASKGNVHRLIHGLADRGAISFQPRSVRSISVAGRA